MSVMLKSVDDRQNPGALQVSQTELWGRLYSYVNGQNIVDLAAWAFNPGSEKAEVSLKRLEEMTSDDKSLCSLIDDIIRCLLSSGGRFCEGDNEPVAYYLKNFIGNLFMILGKEVLEERGKERFDCAADMLKGVFEKITGKFTERLEDVKTLSDSEIQGHVDEIIDYFFDKVRESEGSWTLKIALTAARCFLKRRFADPIARYYCSYADIARQADEMRSAPQYWDIEDTVDNLSQFLRCQVQKQFYHLPFSLKSLFSENSTGFTDENQRLLVDVSESCVAEFFARNQRMISDIETFLLGRFINLGEGSCSVKQKTTDALGEYLPVVCEEVEKAAYAVGILASLKSEADQSSEALFRFKNAAAAFMLQNRIKLLNSELEVCDKEDKNLLKVELQKASVQMKDLGDNMSDDVIRSLLQPVVADKEVDWSFDYEAACQTGNPDDFYDLFLAIVMSFSANRLIDKALVEKFESNGVLQEFKLSWGLKLASLNMGRIAHDIAFYSDGLKPELERAKSHLAGMQSGKGTVLIALLQQIARISVGDDEGNPVLLGGLAAIMNWDNSADDGEKRINALLFNTLIILTSRVLRSPGLPGTTLDEKFESLFKGVSDIVDDAFRKYEAFANSSVSEKESVVDKECHKSSHIKYRALLLREEGFKGEKLSEEIYKYCLVLEMSRKLIESLVPEKHFADLLPFAVRDFSVYEGIVHSFHNKIQPHFDSLYLTYQNLRDSDSDRSAGMDQQIFESFLCDFVLHSMTDYAESFQETPSAGELTVVKLFCHLFTKSGIRAVVDKMQTGGVLGESTNGAVRRLGRDLTEAFPGLLNDPALFTRISSRALELTADYFEEGLQAGDGRRFGDLARFADDYTTMILYRIYPKGARGVPVPESFQKALWSEMHGRVKGGIEDMLTQVEDKTRRKALILKLLGGEAPHGSAPDEFIEQSAMGCILELATAKIPYFLRNDLVMLLLAPIVWILSLIVVNRSVRSTRKLLGIIDRQDFPRFFRKLIWLLSEEALNKVGGAAVDKFQKNICRIADQLDIPFLLSRFGASKATPEAFMDEKLTILSILKQRQTTTPIIA